MPPAERMSETMELVAVALTFVQTDAAFIRIMQVCRERPPPHVAAQLATMPASPLWNEPSRHRNPLLPEASAASGEGISSRILALLLKP